jgi:predicted NUDIX family NTP pyrophosphohydrolase
MSEQYNGWSNRKTWLVNVWFNPESRADVDYARETIEEEWNKMPGFMQDFCDIGAINWDELVEHFDEESEDDE